MRSPRVLLALVLAAVAALALAAREVHNQRITTLPNADASQGWFSFDPDTLYHARRVRRLLDEGLPVAGRDPLLAHPDGAAIPWPPHYTLLLGALLAPFAPEPGPERDAYLETGVAGAAAWFGVLQALLAAGVAWRLARTRALGEGAAAAGAACAGAVVALCGASLHYSAFGNGDHHAIATLLMAATFALAGEAARPERLASRRAGLWLGAAAGACAGALLGTWVGAVVHVALVQAALGWLVVRATREELPGLAPFGLAFHLVALAVLAPAALASPWNVEQPWSVVNLSHAHLVWLALGALVFAPLPRLAAGSGMRRAWPWIVLAALALGGLGLATLDAAPARGVREGFAWAARSDGFMDFIAESQPLLWGQAGSLAEGWRLAGLAPLAMLLLLPFAAWRALARREGDLLVWTLAAPVLLLQTLVQRRFGDALAPIAAVLVGLGLALVVARGARRLAPLAWAALGLCAGAALEGSAVARGVRRIAAGEHLVRGPQAATWRAERALVRWLGEHGAPGAVLAPWYHGHAIEWVAERPSVATNFGSYVGVEGYLAPWRFLVESDPAAAEAILAERDARYVLVDGGVADHGIVMQRALGLPQTLVVPTSQGPRAAPEWYASMAGRLAFEGRVLDVGRGTAGEPLDFLRLVHASSEPHALPPSVSYLPPGSGMPPAGWIWERVPGAQVELHGAAGAAWEIAIELEYPGRPRPLVWSQSGHLGVAGAALVRVPYATDRPNGDGTAAGPARLQIGGVEHALDVPEAAVLGGRSLRAP